MAGHNAGSQPRRRRRKMLALKINEISGVDVPAQEGAVAVILKRVDPSKQGGAPDPQKDVSKSEVVLLTSEEQGHSHEIRIFRGDGGGSTGFSLTPKPDGEESTNHDHPWVMTPDGQIIVGLNDGHTHSVEADQFTQALMALAASRLTEEVALAVGKGEQELPEGGKLADLLENEDSGQTEPETKEGQMATEKSTKAADGTPTVEQLQAQLARANSVASLNDAEKVHFEALKGDEADAFLAKSADDRKADLEKVAKASQDADPVVYTTKDGVELRKSVGAGFIAIAKSNDVLRDEVAELREDKVSSDLKKRAETELSHIPGTIETRTEMLKAIEGIKDEAAREASLNALKAQNEAMSKAFIVKGHGGSSIPGSPGDELDQLAKAYHAKHPEMTIEKAYTMVTSTEEGADLYAKSVN